MTYKYIYIRRAMYEGNPTGNLNTYRRFSDTVRLFKRPFWIMLGVLLVSIISFLVLIAIFSFRSPFVVIPIIPIMVVLVLSEIVRERYFYNDEVRVAELSGLMQNYEKYIAEIKEILQKHGIDSPEKIMKLKTECETALKTHEEKFKRVNRKITEVLIGVPLVALVASIIYTDSNAAIIAIVIVIITGVAFLGAIQLMRKINYYSEGYFKDRYLLDAINELSYS